MSEMINLSVNGKDYCVEPLAGEMLSDLLRERLRLTGTKIGCNEAECGACTVLVDGQPVLSCSFPAAKASGHKVVTIEGLAQKAENGHQQSMPHITSQPVAIGQVPSQSSASLPPAGLVRLHPLQDAFIKHGAVQCGFCIPGQIMTSYALLQRNPDPSEEDIRYALKDTLCRCAGYPSIISAIQAAAKSLRTGQPVEPPQVPAASRAGKVVGNIHPRPDAVSKVTGAAIFSDDLKFDGMLHARVKRAMVPAAMVRAIDIRKAQALPGVAAVLTAADIPGEHNHGLVIYDWPSLIGVGEKVRYVGDAIAIVAAETLEIAAQAMELIVVEYDLLPVVSSAVQAAQPGAPLIHDSGNLLKHIKVRKGDVEEGFANADIVMEHTFNTPPHDHAFIEPECSIARLSEDGRMEVYVGSQIPYQDRNQVARALGWAEDRVHIIGQHIGGGFGGKEDVAGQIHAALLAYVTRRPVKLLFDRQESLIVHPKRHATQIRVKVGARADGTLLAVQSELYGDTGAYASLGEKVLTRATTHSSGPYEIPNARADCYAMYTNNPPAGAFRGFGVLQSAFAVESLMDMLAERLGMDPVALRRKNALHVGSITNTGQTLRDSVGLNECIDKVDAEMRRLGGPEPFKVKVDPGAPYLKRAWGFAVGYKNTGLGGGAPDKAGAQVELYADGHFEIRTASAELGQGLPSVLQLIACEELGQTPERVRVLLSDTDLTPDGGPTTASRQTYVTGNAVRYAAKALREALTSELSEHYDVAPGYVRFEEGLARVNGHTVPLGKVAEQMAESGRKPVAEYTYWAPTTQPLGTGGDMHFAYSFAAQAAEVEVDTRTGEVTVVRVIVANDVGYAINPLGLKGQIEGGIVMGIGQALVEDFIVEQGVVITDRLARYRIPSITFTPEIIPFVVEDPTADGPHGAKGVGEIVLIPTLPAITNAIYNATGIRVDHLPVDQEKIAKALHGF